MRSDPFLERAAAVLDRQRNWREFSGHWATTDQGLPEPNDFPDLLSWLRATPLLLALYGQLAERGEPLALSLPAQQRSRPTGAYAGRGQRIERDAGQRPAGSDFGLATASSISSRSEPAPETATLVGTDGGRSNRRAVIRGYRFEVFGSGSNARSER